MSRELVVNWRARGIFNAGWAFTPPVVTWLQEKFDADPTLMEALTDAVTSQEESVPKFVTLRQRIEALAKADAVAIAETEYDAGSMPVDTIQDTLENQ